MSLFVSILLLTSIPVAAFEEVSTTIFGVAIKGYDTVAYHTKGQALKGSSKYAHKWNDATWYFSSQEHKDLFIKDPEKYAPRYGGY
jgi:YHS domain-containing protein